MLLEKRRNRSGGFSLLELMTVVSIMAVLATISFPGIKIALMNAQMTRSLADIRSIGLGLRSWATDNEGVFPAGETFLGEEIASSNDAFRLLVPDYVDSEKIFSVSRSARGSKADNRIESAAEILEPGENHFAYVAGLFDTSRSNWPLVADGTNGTGTYVREVGQKGGCWEGRKALVAFVGGSAEVIRLQGDDSERYIPREGYPEENALDVSYMGDTVELLEADES